MSFLLTKMKSRPLRDGKLGTQSPNAEASVVWVRSLARDTERT